MLVFARDWLQGMKNPVQKKKKVIASARGNSAREKINPALVELAKLLARISAERDYEQLVKSKRSKKPDGSAP